MLQVTVTIPRIAERIHSDAEGSDATSEDREKGLEKRGAEAA